jgi:hypothetical protein
LLLKPKKILAISQVAPNYPRIALFYRNCFHPMVPSWINQIRLTDLTTASFVKSTVSAVIVGARILIEIILKSHIRIMKREILTVCKPCGNKRMMIPRESKHPASLVRINRDCDKHWTEDSVEVCLDKFNREIHPQSGKPL